MRMIGTMDDTSTMSNITELTKSVRGWEGTDDNIDNDAVRHVK